MIIDRWSKIISILMKSNGISVIDLATKIDVSIATIRRDIKQLSDRKVLTCKNGIVALKDVDSSISPDFSITDILFLREGDNQSVKTNIARYAATLINDNDIIYIDAGTTTTKIIPFIRAKNILVITNSATALPNLIAAGIKTNVCGGFISRASGGIHDNKENVLKDMNIVVAFLGAGSINASGFYSSFKDTQLKGNVISRSKDVYVLADSSKYEKTSFLKFASPGDVTLISDKKPPYDVEFKYIVVDN